MLHVLTEKKALVYSSQTERDTLKITFRSTFSLTVNLQKVIFISRLRPQRPGQYFYSSLLMFLSGALNNHWNDSLLCHAFLPADKTSGLLGLTTSGSSSSSSLKRGGGWKRFHWGPDKKKKLYACSFKTAWTLQLINVINEQRNRPSNHSWTLN